MIFFCYLIIPKELNVNSHVWNAWTLIDANHQPRSGWIAKANISQSIQSHCFSLNISLFQCLYLVIQPLPGFGYCPFIFSIHFIYGYSYLNPSDLVWMINILGHFVDNHKYNNKANWSQDNRISLLFLFRF